MRPWANLERVLPLPGHVKVDAGELGDSYWWGAGIPMVYRALAAPGGSEKMLAPPAHKSSYADSSEALPHACAYWAALLHLLTFSFGWTQPGAGLLSWFAAGRPDDDPRLALLNATYWRDQQLGALILWLLQSPYANSGVWHGLAQRRGVSARQLVTEQHRKLLSIQPAPRQGVPNPLFNGDGDPLHLSSHLTDAISDVGHDAASFGVTDRRARHAVLVCPSMTGWYEALCQRGDELQDGTSRSWRIEVFIRPVGLMGVYRRSRDTNVWFSGRHRYHTWGTPSTM